MMLLAEIDVSHWNTYYKMTFSMISLLLVLYHVGSVMICLL